MMDRANSFLGMTAGFLSVCARHVAQTLAGLITLPLIVRALGPEGLGAWALLGTTSFLVGLSDLGLSVAVQRAAARSEDAVTRRLLRLTTLVVAIVCPCLSACAYALLLRLPSASEALQADVSRAAFPALVAGLVGSLMAPLRAFLLMRAAFPSLAWARTAASTAQVGLTAVGLAVSPSLIAPASGLLAGAALEALLLTRAARRIDPRLDLRPRWPGDPSEVRDAFRQGAAALAINVGVAAAIRADIVILTAWLPLSSVGAYQVASRAVDQIFSFAKQASGWLLHRLGDPSGRLGALRLGTALLGGLVTSGVMALALDGPALLEAWVGPLARDPITVMAVTLLGAAAILAAAEEIAAAALTVSGSTAWDVARPMLLGHGLNVAVSFAGVGHFGAWAVAGGTVCGNLVIALLVWRKARALVHWRAVDVLRALAPLGAAGFASLLTGWALAPLAAGGALASALACGAVTLLGTAAALLAWWRRGDIPEPMPTGASGEGAPLREQRPTCASSS
jgi:O-antigen/teichoic acid export membrane protein